MFARRATQRLLEIRRVIRRSFSSAAQVSRSFSTVITHDIDTPEQSYSPNIETYNILLSEYGGIKDMEATVKEMYNSRVIPNLYTFNILIERYLGSGKWNRMESAYSMMKEKGIEPDIGIYKLMFTGYACSGNLKKMEEFYEVLKQQHSSEDDILSIHAMICAYKRSYCGKKIEKIDFLYRLIPEGKYSSSLIKTLIECYAEEKLLDKMEEMISVAFKDNVVVTSTDVIHEIFLAYYQHNAVDKLSSFVKRAAESAWWRDSMLIYSHCNMVVYASEGRLEKIQNVLEEKEKCACRFGRKRLPRYPHVGCSGCFCNPQSMDYFFS